MILQGMPQESPTRQRAEQTRVRILEAAATRLAVAGYHGTSYAELIADSGLSKGAFYHYFRSKQELAAAVFSFKQTTVIGAIQGTVEGITSPWKRLQAALRVRAKLFATDRSLQCLPRLSTDFASVPDLAPQIAASHEVPIRWFQGLLEEAVAQGEIHPDLDCGLIARVLFSALVGINELSQRESGGKDHVRRNEEVLAALRSLVGLPADSSSGGKSSSARRKGKRP
jgi:AcrR family transcriptional regulator